MDTSNVLSPYIGQILFIKTNNNLILWVKVMSECLNTQSAYHIKVFKKNSEHTNINMVIHAKEINRLCILPLQVQQGIELTVNYVPPLKDEVVDSNGLTPMVKFGDMPFLTLKKNRDNRKED